MKIKQFCLFFILIFSALIFCGCVNPTLAIEPDLKRFKTENANQILKFNGKNRVMQYAWSGDPKKRPLLFVHGSPGSWDGWSHFLLDPELQKNFQLIAVDRPGYGGSKPGTSVGSLEIQAADVMEVLKINQSGLPVILVGHSYGGPVIARAAMDFPNQILGLVFVASSVSPELESTKWYQYLAAWWPLRLLVPSSLRVCNEEIMALKPELMLMMPFWKDIKAQSVLIQGEADNLVPPENLDFLEKHLDHKTILKVMRVKDMNHFVPWQHPELIIEGINLLNATKILE